MDDSGPVATWLKHLDETEGWLTARNASGRESPLEVARHRYSLTGVKSGWGRPRRETLDLRAHHGFTTPKVVKASHGVLLGRTPRDAEWRQVRARDSVEWSNRREVARNLFLDRVPEAGK